MWSSGCNDWQGKPKYLEKTGAGNALKSALYSVSVGNFSQIYGIVIDLAGGRGISTGCLPEYEELHSPSWHVVDLLLLN
jgi:hypothetical protein